MHKHLPGEYFMECKMSYLDFVLGWRITQIIQKKEIELCNKASKYELWMESQWNKLFANDP